MAFSDASLDEYLSGGADPSGLRKTSVKPDTVASSGVSQSENFRVAIGLPPATTDKLIKPTYKRATNSLLAMIKLLLIWHQREHPTL